MGKEQIVVGLEIGTSKVCAVVGEIKLDGTVKILGVGEAPSRGVRKGEIVDDLLQFVEALRVLINKAAIDVSAGYE